MLLHKVFLPDHFGAGFSYYLGSWDHPDIYPASLKPLLMTPQPNINLCQMMLNLKSTGFRAAIRLHTTFKNVHAKTL